MQQRSRLVASIQAGIFRDILEGHHIRRIIKYEHSKITTSEFSAIAFQKGSLLNHIITKNIQEYLTFYES